MGEYKEEFSRKITKVRSKKLNARVDLTAMVGVSFLLIAFFMLHNGLSKPNTLELGLPDNDITCGPIGCGGENRSVTLLLGDNDKMVTYTGQLSYPIQNPKVVKYGKEGIRRELLNKKMLEYSAEIGKPGRGIVVIIKPSKKCNYKNLVDILDEMEITGIQSYVLVNDFTPDEAKLLL